MRVIESLDSPLPLLNTPVSLTIGTFDGMHLGHIALLKELQGTKVVISFTNHPVEVLHPEKKIRQLCSTKEKINLFEKAGVDFLYLFPFTKEFSLQSPRLFLEKLRTSIPFDSLVLGEDAVIGKKREGTKEVVEQIAKDMNFTVRYIPDVLVNGKRPSSSLIRNLLDENKILEAELLLGRVYSC